MWSAVAAGLRLRLLLLLALISALSCTISRSTSILLSVALELVGVSLWVRTRIIRMTVWIPGCGSCLLAGEAAMRDSVTWLLLLMQRLLTLSRLRGLLLTGGDWVWRIVARSWCFSKARLCLLMTLGCKGVIIHSRTVTTRGALLPDRGVMRLRLSSLLPRVLASAVRAAIVLLVVVITWGIASVVR